MCMAEAEAGARVLVVAPCMGIDSTCMYVEQQGRMRVVTWGCYVCYPAPILILIYTVVHQCNTV